ICLCSMLAADLMVLPADTQSEIQGFFQDTEAWLTSLLQQGADDGCWACQPSAAQEAKGLLALLQGAQLMARSSANSAATFEQVVYPLIDSKFSNP
ncbi:MAG: TetR/AcrR family transcriptional regulator, partial [Moorea sp. SIO3C2]|nr:TetR/AcrR family transcriptional regulator [Moorena sp. SIO3C2]